MENITIAHGSGGKATDQLIRDIFFKYFKNNILDEAGDSAVCDLTGGKIAFTTDSFVVKPVFFPGGDIGKLSICGTVNDIAVTGAIPRYISCGFIIEEGFPVSDLREIVKSMAFWAEKSGVMVVTGDTKVVEKGEADEIFINTSGVGTFPDTGRVLRKRNISRGDKVIISGTIGDHGLAVLSQRKGFEFERSICSDCAPLNGMIASVLEGVDDVSFMRDPTRGGLATTLNEITGPGLGVLLDEVKIPVAREVKSASELLGLDPLYIANEGKILVIVPPGSERRTLDIMRRSEYGENSETIGEITGDDAGKVCIRTRLGVTRIIDMLMTEQLPRIC